MSKNRFSQFQQELRHDSQFNTTGSEIITDFKAQTLPANYKKYGNMKVLIETQSVLITLGPDYPCFLTAFILFLVSAVFIIIYVNQAFQNIFVKLGNAIFAITQLLSYLMVALSNPGIVLREHETTQQNVQQEEIKRFCRVCHLKMYKNVHHCRDCGVCVRNYDHHCPWTSKCIGGSNLKRFYFFVSITPIYLIYYMMMMLVSLAVINSNSPK